MVQDANQNAGTLSIESLPQDLRDAFKERAVRKFSETLVVPDETNVQAGSTQLAHASELALSVLLGAWSETSDGDKKIVETFVDDLYSRWVKIMRETLSQPEAFLSHKENKWRIVNRTDAWQRLAPLIFDEQLDKLQEVAVKALQERDPQFDLPPEERFTASVHGKNLSHSSLLRQGLAESLAMLGSLPKTLISCTIGKAERTAAIAVKDVFSNADWKLWASLNPLLPFLAEAAPDQFLDAVENALRSTICPFDTLFAQEGKGIFGNNYLTGLFWALETLAWDEQFLTRVTVLLGELATRDPGGRWANRPANSLTTIFLPWFPQTKAPVQKRRIAIESLLAEAPDVGWKLLLTLLPNAVQTSSGTHKPTWRDFAVGESSSAVPSGEYWDQVSNYAELMLDQARRDLYQARDTC